MSRTVGCQQQGAFTKWDGMLWHRITRAHIMGADLNRVWFLVQAVYNALLGPTTLSMPVDMIITLKVSKQLIILELTVPVEEHTSAQEEKC